MSKPSIPIIDVSEYLAGRDEAGTVARAIGKACREFGFFYIVGHGVDNELQKDLERLSREFFSQPSDVKRAIRMERGGRAWRGFFPVGAELTSGRPDQKEGIYFGTELNDDHPKVQSQVPLHGQNLFPDIPGFRETVLNYMDALTSLGHSLMELLSLSLELNANYFQERFTADPLVLFRVFHYPPLDNVASTWSVGEHTDYGILTILRQDYVGGLQVKSQSQWIDAPPIPGSFICNIGDMLDRMTAGLYRSTPHRVLNTSNVGRLSFPFFFDPNFDVEVHPIKTNATRRVGAEDRWDNADIHGFTGTYGDYLLNKVSKVFPELRRDAIDREGAD